MFLIFHQQLKKCKDHCTQCKMLSCKTELPKNNYCKYHRHLKLKIVLVIVRKSCIIITVNYPNLKTSIF